MTCRIDTELEANPPYPNGLPTSIVAFGHASHDCTRVHVVVRAGATGTQTPPPLVVFDGFADTAYQSIVLGTSADDPQNDGVWQVEFPAPPGFPCGLQLWVDATCVAGGGTCAVHGWRTLGCKNNPQSPGAGGGSGPGAGTGTSDWPWPWPPFLTCPRFGRLFVTLLLLGLVLVAWWICMPSAAILAAGGAALALAGLAYFAWQYWCLSPYCYVWGGVLWAFKRATLAALVLALIYLSFSGWIVMIAYGTIGGWVMLRLQRSHCPIPSGRTPLQQLPFY